MIELAGLEEIARALEVSRSTVIRWAASSGFPRPVAELKAGRVWLLPEVRGWHRRRLRRIRRSRAF